MGDYRIADDEPDRITAFFGTTTIVGAYIPPGELTWRLFLTSKLCDDDYRCHPIVCTRAGAKQWVEIIARLYASSQHEVWSPQDSADAARLAARFDTGSCAQIGGDE